ncbi:hypothetical protein GE107_15410 [Cohnella sp. CFH 77786]|uniref:glycine zipper domain-containing protein n=1 Tax=Cohnella sp. CFH 77786 TaxID=2662265 RepID=UPI001C60C117|nr:glycine zipper domain-containing protein [Cohnella sp. CFH 77786]MBW5447445.1 hypothetical protein [Cohnella sp. CFH 77786]
MAGEVAELSIDSSGLVQTQMGLQALERYMMQLEKRSKLFNRMRISPVVQLMANQMVASLDLMKSRLVEMTSKVWPVETEPSAVQQSFTAKGAEAGAAFTEAFLTAFDTDKIAKKAKDSLEAITVNVNVNGGDSGDGINWGEKFVDLGSNIISGTISGIAANLVTDRLIKRKGSNTSSSHPTGGSTGSGSAVAERRSILSGSQNKPQSLVDADGNPLSSKTSAPDVGKKGNKILNAGKKLLASIFGSNNPTMGYLPTRGLKSDSAASALKRSNQYSKLASGAPYLGSASSLAGKAFRPLSVISDIANIATAKPGKERNRAIGSALGGWGGAAAGAAIGTAILPGVGTLIGGAIGGLAGSSVGEFVGEKLGKASDKLKSFLGFGRKKKKKEEVVPPPTPPSIMPLPTATAQAALPGAAPLSRQLPGSQHVTAAGAVSINVNLPTGAVQLTVEDKLNYDEISALIGSKIAASIQQAMENRA